MTLVVTRPEPGIYVLEAGQFMSMDDMAKGLAEVSRSVDSHDEPYFVSIGDLTYLTRVPFDVSGIRKLIANNRNPLAVLLVSPPNIASIMGNILDKVTAWNFEEVKTRDEALRRAREILAEKQRAEQHR